jgi:hypothetical protein
VGEVFDSELVLLAEAFDGAGTVDVEESGDGVEDETSVVVLFDMIDDVAVPEGVVVLVNVEMSEVAGGVDVEASGTVGDVLETVVLLASEFSNVGGVDVDLTKGRPFVMYELSGCTA